MISSSIKFLYILGIVVVSVSGLSTDGILLLSFKYSVTSDPLSVLDSWNYDDGTPCLWHGVTCTKIGDPGSPGTFRVTSLVLPGSQLAGSISSHLGFIEHLRHLDLSDNYFNGSLPGSIFNNSAELQLVSLSGNEFSGELPKFIGALKSLQVANFSRNAFVGSVHGGFSSVQVLDLSYNLLNGSLPHDFGGMNLNYLNLSNNKLSGPILSAFAKNIPGNATIDLSFNHLSGVIPEAESLLGQKSESFRGNLYLCGKPLKNLCTIPSSHSYPPNVTTTSPAIAVIPKPVGSTQESSTGTENRTAQKQSQHGLKPGTIAAIAVADIAGAALLAMIILYVYKHKTRKTMLTTTANKDEKLQTKMSENIVTKLDPEEPVKKSISWSCITLKCDDVSQTTASDSEHDEVQKQEFNRHYQLQQRYKEGKLVMLDGMELEMETLLKASAYILGTSNETGSIVYRAVLSNGTTFAVRRMGESCILKTFKEFENQVRVIAKLKHPNLVSVRGFYWGDEERLIIYDYVSDGSLATSYHGNPYASPSNLPLQVRFKIARGVAKSLAFLHDKKHVHGNLKPNNILLNHDMEPLISDFGLDRLINIHKPVNSSHHHPNDTASSSSTATFLCPYYPPESMGGLKPNSKWDVYSFGVILLELLTGRVLTEIELSQWTGPGLEDKNRALGLVDMAIRGEVEAKEDYIWACLKLGFSCVSYAPRKRPSMKEALKVLENVSFRLKPVSSYH